MIVLAVDPGLAKCGIAVVDSEMNVLHRSVIQRDQIAQTITGLISRFNPTGIIVGKGTGSAKLLAEVEPVCGELHPALVDERFTTLQARGRYFKENPPRGLRRLVPRGLLSPGIPIDDYAAVILAEEFIRRSK